MEPGEVSRSAQPWIGAVLMWIGGLGALAIGVAISTGIYGSALGWGVVASVLPFLIVFVIGCLLA
jgi:hypothetical protein